LEIHKDAILNNHSRYQYSCLDEFYDNISRPKTTVECVWLVVGLNSLTWLIESG